MPRLVGRDAELDALASWLDGAESGRGTVALISGEPGIGKTRFLEECAARAADRGFAVAWGRAWEVSSAPPYWPWIEALRALGSRPGGRDASAVELERVLPELGRGASSSVGVDPFPLYDAVVGYLEAAAAREPVVVVLDDLHVADPSSLQLAALVAPQLKRMRIVLLGSHRDVEARRDPGVEAALGKLGRAGHTLALQRLDPREVGAIVNEVTGRDDDAAARMIHEASDGNPLFVRELLKLLAARSSGPVDVPAGVRAVIRERLALLSPATVALLQAAAVVGRTFAVTLAAEVAGVTTAALEEAIDEAVAADVVIRAEAGCYRFSHALVAETLAGELPVAVRTRSHRRAAETLARHHADDPLAPFGEIAHHWRAAGAECAPQAIAAARRAAEAAEARVAFADAAVLYEHALEALAIAQPGSTLERAELLLRQGQAYVRGGDRARAQPPCVAASELARGLRNGELFARAALALGADVAVGQVDRVMIRMLEEALTLLPPGDDPWRAQVMARLAAARQPARNPREPVALALDAVAMARRLGDRRVLADVMFAAIGALTDFARPEQRVPLNEEVARFASEHGDRPRLLRSLQRLAFDRVDLGDVDGFELAVSEYDALATELRQPRYAWVPLMFRSMRAQWEGRHAEATRLAEEAFAIRERLGDATLEMQQIVRRSMIEAFRDPTRIDEVTTLMTPGFEAFAHALRGWAHAHNRRLPEARAELEWLHHHAESEISYHGLGMLGQLAWTLRDRPLAARLHPYLVEEHGRPLMVTSIGFMVMGLADHELMRTSALLEQWDDVDRYAEAALALCAKLGARPLAARVRAEWAVTFVERGGADALPRARELATLARAAAIDLDVPDVVMTCDELQPRLGGAPLPVAAVPRSASDAVVTITCEGEFWTVAGFGELCRIKDSRGIQMLAKLIASPGRELHALDLVDADVVDAGDAGEVIDRDTKAAYQNRLRTLRAELEEAESWNDAGRRDRIAEEIGALTAELSSAYGLGRRERRVARAAERARQNVRRRLADAMRRIEEACPTIGRHLAAAVRTGTTSTYDPARRG
ncbi:MAG: AAA family ATPase [Kofleriaceae bacterium]